MYGLYSRAASNQERPMMARVRYIKKNRIKEKIGYLSSYLSISQHILVNQGIQRTGYLVEQNLKKVHSN